jgi:hypothetical protein
METLGIILLMIVSHMAVAALSGWVFWNVGYTSAQPRRDERGRFTKGK